MEQYLIHRSPSKYFVWSQDMHAKAVSLVICVELLSSYEACKLQYYIHGYQIQSYLSWGFGFVCLVDGFVFLPHR